jgi:hypothetical protein
MSELASSPEGNGVQAEEPQPIEGPPANTPPLDILLKKHFLRSHPGPLDEATLLDYLSCVWTVDPHTFCVSNVRVQDALWS